MCCISAPQAVRVRRGEMKASVSIEKGTATYLEDMTLDANVELGDPGACRRR